MTSHNVHGAVSRFARALEEGAPLYSAAIAVSVAACAIGVIAESLPDAMTLEWELPESRAARDVARELVLIAPAC